MRVLMIAPQPVFEPRGAPFCVYQHIQALIELGVEVDLVTYPMGQPIDLPNLNIFRVPRLPFVRQVKPGFSLAKFPLDLLVFLTALRRLCARRYSYLFTHEEAALLGVPLAFLFSCKHLYYMHCNLAELISENRLIFRCAQAVQAFMVRRADAVIAFYPELARTAKQMAPRQEIYTVLPPAVDEGLSAPTEEDAIQLREELDLQEGPVLLYTGTLESYQGLDLLLRSAVTVHAEFPAARYVIAGGKPQQVEELRSLAEDLGIAQIVRFAGQRPLEEMPRYMALATILLSPRSKANHVPLKLYTYLRSGKPILATNILSHTQILSPAIALLVPPTPEGLAQGTLELLRHPHQAQILGYEGHRYAAEHYSWSAFVKKCAQVYEKFVSSSDRAAFLGGDQEELVQALSYAEESGGSRLSPTAML
jgi:glycosyltransferase involved in cell wall biosynthesis